MDSIFDSTKIEKIIMAFLEEKHGDPNAALLQCQMSSPVVIITQLAMRHKVICHLFGS